MDHGVTYIILACVFGAFMAWGIGANDVSNAMGTSVGSKALTFFKATIIAAIFEAAGAILAGGEVANTIGEAIIDPTAFALHPQYLIYGMLSALLSASLWLLIASYKGLPISTTHTIIGAIVGFASIEIGVSSVHWQMVVDIVLSWIVTPFLAGILAFLIFTSIQFLILNTADPVHNAKRYSPVYVFLVIFIMAMVTLSTGLPHLNIHLTMQSNLGWSLVLGFLGMIPAIVLLSRNKSSRENSLIKNSTFDRVESIFAILQIFTACCMAFAHGSNDVANAIGPVTAILGIVQTGGNIGQQTAMPTWVLFLGAGGIVVGLATYGYKVICTVGKQITELTPSRGFSAELATAGTVVLASGLGLPISTTQTLIGAILGVGFARGIAAINLSVIRSVFMSWVITLPIGAVFSILFYLMFKGIFGG